MNIDMFKKYPITYGLILVNVVIFVITFIFLQAYGPSIYVLYTRGVHVLNLKVIFSILLSGFTHFSFLHIFSNMLFLYYIGRVVEKLIKPKYYLLLYFTSLFFSGVCIVYLSSPITITIGASGALYGLFSFIIVYYYLNVDKLKYFFDIKQIWILLVINIAFTLIDSNVSNIGHISGFISGICVTFLIHYMQNIKRI